MDFSNINIEFIFNSISTILLMVLPFIFKIQLAKIEKNQNSIHNDNQKMMDYFQIDMAHDRYIHKLYEIKNHFNFGFTDEKLKYAMNEKANNFIGVVEKILNNYEIGIINLNNIKNEFETNRNYVKSRLEYFLTIDGAYHFRNIHDKTYNHFINDIEDILTSTENHYKERFINKCCDFMKFFIKELREFQYSDGA